MAYTIKTDGTTTEVTPANGTDFSLEELQGFVGGSMELVRIRDGSMDGAYMVVNEDGLNIGLPHNAKANLFYPYSPIVGDVLICSRDQVQ